MAGLGERTLCCERFFGNQVMGGGDEGYKLANEGWGD